MYEKSTVIKNPTGMHARPAAEFVDAAKKFASKITIHAEGGEPVNAKSVIRLLSAGLTAGAKVSLCAEGEDEREAVDTLVALIDSGFGEV